MRRPVAAIGTGARWVPLVAGRGRAVPGSHLLLRAARYPLLLRTRGSCCGSGSALWRSLVTRRCRRNWRTRGNLQTRIKGWARLATALPGDGAERIAGAIRVNGQCGFSFC